MTESVLIVGTGAMACLFAARLAASGVEVTLLGSWPEGVAAIRSDGVRLVEMDDTVYPYRVRVATHPAECCPERLALVLVKAWQTERAARQLAECLASDGLAFTLQNGIGNREKLSAVFGERRVLVGATTLGATLLAAGQVRAAGEGLTTLAHHPGGQMVYEMLRSAGLEVVIAPDIESVLWGKLVINSAINPLTALLRIPNGGLLERSETRTLLGTAARETAAVADAWGISLPFLDPAAAVEAVAQRTATNLSSMLQDVMRFAPTEIDAINGAVVQAGEGSGVLTPLHRVLWALVRSLPHSL